MREYDLLRGGNSHSLPDGQPFSYTGGSAVPKEELSDEALLERLGAIYSRAAVAAIRKSLEEPAADPERAGEYKEYRETFLRRMWDVSKYMKAVKQSFTQWFNGEHDRKDTLWEGRFHSVLVEGTPEALSVIAAYFDQNSIRAGAAKDPKDYHWSGYGEAMGGNQKAQEALKKVLPPGHKNLDAYRMLLYAHGAQEGGQIDHRTAGSVQSALFRGWGGVGVQRICG